MVDKNSPFVWLILILIGSYNSTSLSETRKSVEKSLQTNQKLAI